MSTAVYVPLGESPAFPVALEMPIQPLSDREARSHVGTAGKVVAAGAAMLALTACNPTHKKSADAAVFKDPAAVRIEQAIAEGQFEQDVNTSLVLSNRADAITQIPIISQGDSFISVKLTDILNDSIAGSLLDDGASKINDPGLQAITNPKLRNTINAGIFVKKVEAGLADSPDGDTPADLQAYVDKVTANAPASAAKQRADATLAAEGKFADGVLTDYGNGTIDEKTATQGLLAIPDKGVRQKALNAEDDITASDALNNSGEYGTKTTAQGRAEIATMHNRAKREKALAALAYVDSELSTIATDVADGFDSDYEKMSDALLNPPAFDADTTAVSDLSTSLTTQRLAEETVVEQAVRKQAGQASGIHPHQLTAEAPETNPMAHIDLSKVNGTQRITNNGFGKESYDGAETPKTYNQFAEVTAQDGKLNFIVAPGANLSDETRRQIETVLTSQQAWLEGTFASGELVSIHFVVSDADPVRGFDPSYYGGSREIYMVLPRDKSVTVNQLSQALRHEGAHAAAEIGSDVSTTKEQKRLSEKACVGLARIAYAGMGFSLTYGDPALLINLKAAATTPAEKKVVDEIVRDAKTDNFGSLLPGDNDATMEYPAPLQINDCEGADLATTIFYDAAAKVDVKTNDLDAFFKTPAYVAVATEMMSHIDDHGPYSTIFDEHNYVQTDSSVKPLLGHTGSGALELNASLADDVIGYNDVFMKKYNAAPASERAVIRNAVAVDFSIIETNKPSYNAYLSSLFAKMH